MSRRPEPVPLQHTDGCDCRRYVLEKVRAEGYHKLMVRLRRLERHMNHQRNKRRKWSGERP